MTVLHTQDRTLEPALPATAADFVTWQTPGADAYRDVLAWIVLPTAPTEPPSPVPGLLHEVSAMTGWARRDLAELLRTSHTTVGRLSADGRVTPRTRDVASRLAELHAVLVRLFRVAGGPEPLRQALTRDTANGNATQLLREGDWTAAYTTALDVLRGPRPTMLGASSPPMQAATRELRP